MVSSVKVDAHAPGHLYIVSIFRLLLQLRLAKYLGPRLDFQDSTVFKLALPLSCLQPSYAALIHPVYLNQRLTTLQIRLRCIAQRQPVFQVSVPNKGCRYHDPKKATLVGVWFHYRYFPPGATHVHSEAVHFPPSRTAVAYCARSPFSSRTCRPLPLATSA